MADVCVSIIINRLGICSDFLLVLEWAVEIDSWLHLVGSRYFFSCDDLCISYFVYFILLSCQDCLCYAASVTLVWWKRTDYKDWFGEKTSTFKRCDFYVCAFFIIGKHETFYEVWVHHSWGYHWNYIWARTALIICTHPRPPTVRIKSPLCETFLPFKHT